MAYANDDAEEIFTNFINFPSCSLVQELNYSERCNYVLTTPECIQKRFYFSYINFLYCVLKPHNELTQFLAVSALMSLCFIMFLVLGTTADKIFCPALKVISNVMGMNEHLAGVTMLAFGNGSPDLFTSLAGVNDTSRLLFSDLYGAAIYVNAFVGGIICVLNPFKLQPNNVLRDICFLLLGLLFIDYSIYSNGSVTILESCLILSIYFIYLFIIIFDQFLLKQHVKKLEKMVKRGYQFDENVNKLEALRSEVGIEIISRTSRASINVDMTRKMSYNIIGGVNENIFSQFFNSLNPFDFNEWQKGGTCSRALQIAKIPVNLILSFIIPIVDYELDGHGWSKLLNSLQLNFLPSIILAATCNKSISGIPIWTMPLTITVPASIYVFCTTRTDLPPNYHFLFGMFSVMGSIFTIYSCASETVQILYVLGMVSKCSNSFLGCTLLAWGNSIGDLVSNISLSRNGYQKMGYAACFGGPFFNSVLAMGGTFLIRSLNSPDGTTVVNRGALGENCLVFLSIVLFSGLIWTCTTNFYARRSVGIFNIILYFLFFAWAIMGECEIIQTYAPESATAMA